MWSSHHCPLLDAPSPPASALKAGHPWGPRLPARARVAISLCPSAPRGSGRGAPYPANSHWAFLSPGSLGLDLVPPGKAVSCARRSREWACSVRKRQLYLWAPCSPDPDEGLGPVCLVPGPLHCDGLRHVCFRSHVCSGICFFVYPYLLDDTVMVLRSFANRLSMGGGVIIIPAC